MTSPQNYRSLVPARSPREAEEQSARAEVPARRRPRTPNPCAKKSSQSEALTSTHLCASANATEQSASASSTPSMTRAGEEIDSGVHGAHASRPGAGTRATVLGSARPRLLLSFPLPRW